MRLAVLSALASTLALAAAPAVPAPRAAAPVRTLAITAKDYAFDAPDTVVAGRTLVRLANQGQELHHAYLMRLEAGKTMADLHAAMQAGGPPPAWTHDVGGPNAPAPGASSAAVVALEPGTYVLLCVIPAADGMPHVMKGMARAITVVPARTAVPAARVRDEASVDAPDVTMTLDDYGFAIPRALTAGRHVVRVTNAAAQPHELFIARLAPGKTVQDVAAWVEKMQGPPPAEPMGGATPLARGRSNDVVLDLAPGEYGLFCFVPDAKDGKPHVAHGMMRQVTVR